jgi:biopolymer transport protein ExbD
MTPFLTMIFLTTFQQSIDGTALTFTLEKDSMTVRVGRWKLRSIDAKEMNRFVDLHIKEIDPNKIVIYSDKKARYKSFQSVIEVLKKHDWLKFRIEDTGPKPQPPTPKVKTGEAYLENT